MTFNHSTIVELEREATRLRRMRDALDAGIRGIEDVLLLGRADEKTLQPGALARRRTTRLTKIIAGSNGHRGALGSALRLLVRESPGIRSGQLVQMLQQQGFAVNGKTGLPDRVYKELRRLVRRGIVSKAADGAYTLNKPRGAGAP